MSQISAQLVKELREASGAGMMDCKKALEETKGNLDEAMQILRKKGLKSVEKRAGRVAAEGVVFSYIHAGGRIGVMLELNSETDFVARGDEFLNLAKEIGMHIAWANPAFVSRDEVPAEILEREKDVYRSQLKPGQEAMQEKILAGKLEKYFETACLLEQFDAKDAASKKRIGDLINDLSAKVGEKIVLRRFMRFEVGEGIEKAQTNFADEVAQAVAGA